MCRLFVLTVAFGAVLAAQTPQPPEWARVEEETMRHFQALLRFDTSDPPGTEIAAAEYLKKVLEAEGIAVQTFALEPHRPNVVARLKGSGAKRPLLIMGHTDVVNVDPKKWTHPPFSATREGGYVYGRGTVDDKDNVVAALMVMLLLKRQNVPLDRDVIFLAEAGEEGSTRVGIQYMVNEHFPEIDAEYCLAEGGSVTRTGRPRQVRVGPDAREDSARDRADGARTGRPRIGPAADERDPAPGQRDRQGGGVEAADQAQRHDPRLLQAAGDALDARRRQALPARS